jgi:hypothetical protein
MLRRLGLLYIHTWKQSKLRLILIIVQLIDHIVPNGYREEQLRTHTA